MQCHALAGDDEVNLPRKYDVLRNLTIVCTMQISQHVPELDLELAGSWCRKADIYKTHALALFRQMGRNVPSKCKLCRKALDADKPIDPKTPFDQVTLLECGHILHMTCLVVRTGASSKCPVCK